MSGLGILIGLAGLAATLATAAGGRRHGGSGQHFTTRKLGRRAMENKAALETMLASLPLDDDQKRFVVLVAYGETAASFNPKAHNDTPSEVKASAEAFDRLPQHTRARLLVHAPRERWAIGSGGFGGRLVPYYGSDAVALGLPVSPDAVFIAGPSLLSLLYVCHRLQQTSGWEKGPHNVASLRVGFYGLAYMREPPPERIEKYQRHAAALGFGRDFPSKRMAPFPDASAIAGFRSLFP